jgi:plasmid stabilization system protein ParE
VNLPVRVDSAASDELTAAIHWYEARRPGLGAEFYDRVVAAIAAVEAQSDIGTQVAHDPLTRRLLLSGFPYQIVYHLRPAEVVVVAVAHMKRRPGYWKCRSTGKGAE